MSSASEKEARAEAELKRATEQAARDVKIAQAEMARLQLLADSLDEQTRALAAREDELAANEARLAQARAHE